MEAYKPTATANSVINRLSTLSVNNNNNNNNDNDNNKSCLKSSSSSSTFPNVSQAVASKRAKPPPPPSLVSLCVSLIGKNLEDLIPDLADIAVGLPAHIKATLAAIARRRKLLTDYVIISLADPSWDSLDISGSDVSDLGLVKVAEICRSLQSLDISRCRKITPDGVLQLLRLCHSLGTLRCGGCPRSDFTAQRCLGFFKPQLNNAEGDSWEELDTIDINNGVHSLTWLVWPNIEPDILEEFSAECPRIKVNPQPSPLGYKGVTVPREALPNSVLDDPVVEDIDPNTWESWGSAIRIVSPICNPDELPIAEKFRLAFAERDTRLAPKRAKNARQHQRRAERQWMMTSTEAKAIALASTASKSLRYKN